MTELVTLVALDEVLREVRSPLIGSSKTIITIGRLIKNDRLLCDKTCGILELLRWFCHLPEKPIVFEELVDGDLTSRRNIVQQWKHIGVLKCHKFCRLPWATDRVWRWVCLEPTDIVQRMMTRLLLLVPSGTSSYFLRGNGFLTHDLSISFWLTVQEIVLSPRTCRVTRLTRGTNRVWRTSWWSGFPKNLVQRRSSKISQVLAQSNRSFLINLPTVMIVFDPTEGPCPTRPMSQVLSPTRGTNRAWRTYRSCDQASKDLVQGWRMSRLLLLVPSTLENLYDRVCRWLCLEPTVPTLSNGGWRGYCYWFPQEPVVFFLFQKKATGS